MEVEVLKAMEAAREGGAPRLSVIIPVYNEEENVPLLSERLFAVLESLPYGFEVVAVNDGSTDRSLEALRSETSRHAQLRIVDFRRNYGQTAALMAGIDHSQGEIIVSLDADLQNDPADIPLLVEKLAEGYDVVSGWRKDRQDAAIRRVLVSRIANSFISFVSGVKLRDYGCTLKAYRREMVKDVRLYGEMHRFIPIYASWMGARVVEMPVKHHPRRFGRSKYGLGRIVKVLLDLMVVKFLQHYFVKPIYVFGGFGFISLFLSLLAGCYMLYLKFAEGYSMILTPLPLVVTMTFLVGVMSILMGLLAEILIRTYFESQQRRAYLVRELVNFGSKD